MSYEEWKKEFVEGELDSKPSGAVNGALNSESDRAVEHAERYYESVKKMKTDTRKIAENTGIKLKHIEQVKNHLFIKSHDLGINGYRKFYADYDIAQSWQRLIEGKNIQPQDIILLKHEYCESRYMDRGYSQNEAHNRANARYDYSKAVRN